MSKILQWLKSLGDNVFKYVYGCRYLNGGTENTCSNINILRFINQSNDDDVKIDEFIQRLCRFKKDIVNDSIKCKRQVTLDRYLV